jgi:Outer membrane protein beta-barrel domain
MKLTPLLALLPSVAVASAADPLGLYIGVAAGQANLGVDRVVLAANAANVAVSSAPFSLSKHDTGWKLQLGLRPISLLGAEIEYVDFGSSSASFSGGSALNYLSYQANTRAKAGTAFGVLYAPIPFHLFDVYGKAGIARIQARTTATGVFGCMANCPLFGNASFHRDETTTRLAYSLGVQMKMDAFAVRGEYERISASTGDQALLSLGITLSF